MARVSKVGLGYTAPERIDWYSNIQDWYDTEKLVDYGAVIEAVCKGDISDSITNISIAVDAPHGAWAYADPSVYYDFTNETVIPFSSEPINIEAYDIRISGIFCKTNGVSAGLEPMTTNNRRTIIEDCRIHEVNPAGTSYGVQINGSGSQANQDLFLRCVISRENLSNTSELVKQAVANGYGALRNCVLIAGAGKYADGSNNVGLEVSDCVGLGSVGYDATSLILNTSSSEDSSGTVGLRLINNTALSDFINDDFRTKAGGALDVAGTNTPYIGVGLDVAAGDGITLTQFSATARNVINREIDGSPRSIPVTVNLTGDPSGGVEWRLVNNTGGAAIVGYDWATFIASPVTGSNTANITAPTSTGMVWYKLQLRFTANVAITAESTHEFAVGALIVDSGQSNMAYRRDRTDTPPAINANAAYCTTSGWEATFSTGNGAIEKANQMVTLLNMPVGYCNIGSISKNMDYFVSGTGWTDLSGLLTNHFSSYAEVMFFDQGEADALIPTSRASYTTKSQTLMDNILSQTGRTQSEFTFCVNYGGNSNGYNVGVYTDTTLENIRGGKADFIANNAGAIWGGHRIDLPLVDTIHNTTVSYEVAAQREVLSYAKHLGLVTYSGDGRVITSSSLVGDTLTVNYSAGEALTKIGAGVSTVTEISEDDFATNLTITATTVNADSVVHTLSAAPATSIKIREYYGIDNDITTRPDLIFPSSAASTVTSTLNITVTGIPDGTYTTVLDLEDGTRLSRQGEVYASEALSITLALPVGVRVKGYVDDGVTPSLKGAYLEGVTI